MQPARAPVAQIDRLQTQIKTLSENNLAKQQQNNQLQSNMIALERSKNNIHNNLSAQCFRFENENKELVEKVRSANQFINQYNNYTYAINQFTKFQASKPFNYRFMDDVSNTMRKINIDAPEFFGVKPLDRARSYMSITNAHLLKLNFNNDIFRTFFS